MGKRKNYLSTGAGFLPSTVGPKCAFLFLFAAALDLLRV